MTNRLFAPTVEIEGLRVPLEEFAETLRAEVAHRARTWVVEDPTVQHFPVVDMVTWPMDATAFLDRGVALLQYLHDICENGGAGEGNEFLDGYNLLVRGYEHLPRPAESIKATLYVSDDRGKTWVDVRHAGRRK